MKIVHLDHSTAPGGAEFALLRMLEPPPPWGATLLVPHNGQGTDGVYELLAARGSVTVRRTGPAQPVGASKAGLSTVLGFVLRAIGQVLAIRVSRELRAADVVHANTSRAAVYGALANLASRRSFVVHLRDFVGDESLGRLGFRLFTRIALKRADGIIANSNATLASAQPYLRPGVPTRVIPSAIGFRGPATAASNSDGVSRVGMVARLAPWKGQELLIRAFAGVFAGEAVRLVLAGGALFGNEAFELELRKLAHDLRIAEQVDFLGHVDDVQGVISTFDICVQASLRPEPLGQNVLQYLAAGRPVIAADAGGPAEWIHSGVNGILFTMGSLESLERALAELAGSASVRSALAEAAVRTPGLMSDSEITTLHQAFFETVRGVRRRDR